MDIGKRFLNILGQINDEDSDSGSYYGEYSIDAKELELCINIEGCSNIALPLSNDIIQKMLVTAEPAKFGLRDQTLYDEDVRDTNEISADKINISYNASKFSFILDNIRKKLSLPGNICLKPHLHNILIYSTGQFFATHQDTEKLDGMLATLVMVLPSQHIGGALRIKHYGEEIECKSENINSTDIKFIAFYSDCQHEVEKITDGYRVVATYNLVAESTSTMTKEDECVIVKHQDALKEAMISSLKEQLTDSSSPIPCITYLLNHQYTQNGLSWNLLRGGDKLRAELIKRAAMEADCEVLLALIEARETWTTDGGYDYGDSNQGEKPQDLVDTSIDVIHAIDIKSKTVKYNQYIREKSLCYHLPNDEFKPFETEYEGYMGNYGNTVDYWYHRAAIIIWRESDSFVLNFLNDPNAVILSLFESSELDIKSQLEKLWSHWSEYRWELINLSLLLELSILVNDSNVADKILQYCSSSTLLGGVNDLIGKVFSHYGQAWSIRALDSWLSHTQSKKNIKEPYDKFGNIIQDFANNTININIINKVIEYQIKCIKTLDAEVDINKPISLAKKSKTLARLIKELIEALHIINDINKQEDVLNYIISKKNVYSALELINLLQKIKDPGLHSLLKNHLLNNLKNEVNSGLRSPDDWRIDVKSSCRCEYCEELNDFINSKNEINKRWPIKQDTRSHVIDMIRKMEAPINHKVEAKGSPHKLILEKSNSIHSDAKIRFEAVSLAYQKLLNEDNYV